MLVVWFLTIGLVGLAQIVQTPGVLVAINPLYAVRFFIDNGAPGFLVLGVAFLAVTGGEALYADMGHFGRHPIRLTWFWFVLPALLLNYFGQGALLPRDPAAAENLFYHATRGLRRISSASHPTACSSWERRLSYEDSKPCQVHPEPGMSPLVPATLSDA